MTSQSTLSQVTSGQTFRITRTWTTRSTTTTTSMHLRIHSMSLRRSECQLKFPSWQKICLKKTVRCHRILRVRMLKKLQRRQRRVVSLSPLKRQQLLLILPLTLRHLPRLRRKQRLCQIIKLWRYRSMTKRTWCQRSQKASSSFQMVDGSAQSAKTTISRVEKNAIGARRQGPSKIWAESLSTCSSPNRRMLQLDWSCSALKCRRIVSLRTSRLIPICATRHQKEPKLKVPLTLVTARRVPCFCQTTSRTPRLWRQLSMLTTVSGPVTGSASVAATTISHSATTATFAT